MADDDTATSVPKGQTCVSLKYTTFCCEKSGEEKKSEENVSLQEAFRIFREAKQDEMRQARLLRKRQELRKANPQQMAALRQKFLNQAKKYYGYPYAKKYWPPDSPEYKSKLFLDCCGLVRKVMRDLAEDFGFIIGPWNQAYMFDTLPIKIEHEKDMKPGDLVFISATYYNPKSKKQRHNMTHVEIWAGEGNKTIGARWNNGKVKMFDHYKFTAKSYHSETYHFRSIDTWLKGICRSHCSQHTWKRYKHVPAKKSIFHLPEQADEDEAAGDDNDNIDNFTVRGNTFINEVKGVSKMIEQCKLAERPKTDMDIRHVNVGGGSLNNALANFPAIKNNLSERGEDARGKRRKGKGASMSELKDSNDTCVTKVASNQNNVGASETVAESLDVRNGNNPDTNKPLSQLPKAESLTDLGKKGFFLKDLVEAQKHENPDSEAERENMSDNGSDDDYLSNGSEDDFDDDYLIFADDQNDSDDEQMMSGSASGNAEVVSDSPENDVSGSAERVSSGAGNVSSREDKVIENLTVKSETDVKDGIECGNEAINDRMVQGVSCGVNDRKNGNVKLEESFTHLIVVKEESLVNARNEIVQNKDNLLVDESQNKEGNDVIHSNKDVEEDEVEGLSENVNDINGCNDEIYVSKDNIESEQIDVHSKVSRTDLDMTDKADQDVTQIEGPTEPVVESLNELNVPKDNFDEENINQNANPKTSDQVQTNTNKKGKGKSECIKASVVTMVSMSGTTSASVLPVESRTSVTSPMLNGSIDYSRSSSSCDTDYKVNNTTAGAK
ncbi:Tubulin tyrosine ligase-like [Mactra antiquata]